MSIPRTSWLSRSEIVSLNSPSLFSIPAVCTRSHAQLRTQQGPGCGFFLASNSWRGTRVGAILSPTIACGESRGRSQHASQDSSWTCFLWNGSAVAGPYAAAQAARINLYKALPLVASCGQRWRNRTLVPCAIPWRVALKKLTPLSGHVLLTAYWLTKVCHASHPPTLR